MDPGETEIFTNGSAGLFYTFGNKLLSGAEKRVTGAGN
jgi:hypothetical protein